MDRRGGFHVLYLFVLCLVVVVLLFFLFETLRAGGTFRFITVTVIPAIRDFWRSYIKH